MNKHRQIFILIIVLFCGVSHAATCEYADYLSKQRRYPAAILEYERFLYYQAESPGDSLYAHEAIIRAYYGAEMYNEMWDYGERHQLLKLSPEYQRRFLSLAKIRQGDYAAASRISEIAHGEKAILLKGIAELYQGNSGEAILLFNLLPANPRPGEMIDKAALLRIGEDAKQVPHKYPWLAGTLAVIPGAGYLYSHKWQTALSALLLHAVFFASAYEMQTKDMPITSTMVYGLGTGYYLGNIYGSVSEAAKYNKRKREEYLEPRLQPYIQYLEDVKPFAEEKP